MPEPKKYIRVRGWDEIYENAATRKLKRLDWFPMPNKQDGDGYSELLDHKNGPTHYAIWCSLLGVVSRSHRRGVLVRANDEIHTEETLARMTRIPVRFFREAIQRLLKIGWLEEISANALGLSASMLGSSANALDLSATDPPPRARAEGKERKKERTPIVPLLERAFHQLVAEYPNATEVDLAAQYWTDFCEEGVIVAEKPPGVVESDPPYSIGDVCQGLARYIESDLWARDDGKYIVSFAKWISGKKWRDHPKISAAARAAKQDVSSEGVDPNAVWQRPDWWKEGRPD